MKLEKQVCNLQLSKRLRELGVKQDSLFWWSHFRSMGEMAWGLSNTTNGDCVSAFTVAELGEILKESSYGFPQYVKSNKTWFSSRGESDTEANERAELLCFLIENKLITL
jgi:hypothetical protein